MSWFHPAVCGLRVFITDFGTVTISESTKAAMDAQFPGWDDLPAKRPRLKAKRAAYDRAKLGHDKFHAAVNAIAELVWAADQDFEQI